MNDESRDVALTAPLRNYPLLLSSQFLGAFGDNVILAVILGPVMKRFQAHEITAQYQQIANIVYTSLLFVPYLVFAPIAGYFNDRFPKTRGLMAGNGLKMLGAVLAWLSLGNREYWMAVGYLIVGFGACLYSPAKYGILPEIVPAAKLVKANGAVELLTMVAILTGNLFGAKIVDRLSLNICYTIVIFIYAFSTLMTMIMVQTPAHREVHFKRNLKEFAQTARFIFERPRLVKIVLGTSLFWICGALMKMNFQPWGQQVMRFTTMTEVAMLGLWLTLGIMAGSVLAGQLHKIGELHAIRRYGFMLAGSVALIACTSGLIKAGFDYPRAYAIVLLIFTGIMAGLFLIPLNAALQAESHQGQLGKTIATQNLIENVAMLGGSAFAYFNVTIGFDPSQIFLALAGLIAFLAMFLGFPKKAPLSAEGDVVESSAAA
jgi:LPLT family lysophospholipid transporter-like MFS transporter